MKLSSNPSNRECAKFLLQVFWSLRYRYLYGFFVLFIGCVAGWFMVVGEWPLAAAMTLAAYVLSKLEISHDLEDR